jgi:lipoprotein-anchoring transpeptidase ErfK/SrfK
MSRLDPSCPPASRVDRHASSHPRSRTLVLALTACAAVIGASADAAAAGLGGGLIEFLFSGGTQSATPQRQAYAPDADAARYAADPRYVRQIVDYHGEEKPGTVIINTPERMLYLVEPGGKALRYGIGVGRPGFTWAGVKTVTMKKEWPDWRPPDEMLRRRPDLPCPADRKTPSAPARSISAIRSTASTAPTSPGPSEPRCRRAASACAMKT